MLLLLALLAPFTAAHSAVSPSSGPVYGGTQVTVTGTGFDPSAIVYFDGMQANNIVYINSTTLTAVTPESYSDGAVDVDVQTIDDYISQPAAFTYISPTVTGVTPSQGTIAGGTNITVSGSLFAAGAYLYINGNLATNITVVNQSTITATTPPGYSEGPADVDVEILSSYVTLVGGYTYREPRIDSVFPSSGSIDGGEAITIQGDYFTDDATVSITGTLALNVNVVDSQTITAITPASWTPGPVDLEITVGSGTGYAATTYTYLEPTILSASPTSGPETGGTEVFITGTLFSPLSTVEFDASSATSVTFIDSNRITATTPGGYGTVDVTVSTPNSQALLSQAFTYTTVPPPQINDMTPQSGDSNGGTAVTISGVDFLNGLSVTLGSTPLSNPTFVNTTTITGNIPALSPGIYSLFVTNPDGQTDTLPNAFTVTQAPIGLIAGDLAPLGNPDGQLNAADFLILQRIVSGAVIPDAYEQLVGDVAPLNNPDGALNAGDLVVLQRAVLGAITLAPIFDAAAPQISVLSPANGSISNQTQVSVILALDEPANVSVNGSSLGQGTSFSTTLTLPQGANSITVSATDLSGNTATEVINVTVDSRAPVPLNISKLLSTQPSSSQAAFTGTTGAVEPGTSVQFTNSTTSATITVVADSNGAFAQTISASNGDVIQISLVDAAGNSSPSLAYTVGTQIQIISPVQNATTNREDTVIFGAFSGASGSGVTVGTQSACLYGNTFYINDYPLALGSNSVTATLTEPSGMSDQHSVQVTRNGSPDLSFQADNACGIAPLQVDFELGIAGINVQHIDIDLDSNGIPDITTTDVDSAIAHTYTTPGVYPVTAWVLDDQGIERALHLNIVVQDEALQNDLFQQIWSNFSTALTAGNSSTALQSIGSPSREYFGPIMEALSGHLPEIAGDFSGIQKIQINEDTAEYAVMTVVDGQVRTFVVTFIKDKDGIWRIWSL